MLDFKKRTFPLLIMLTLTMGCNVPPTYSPPSGQHPPATPDHVVVYDEASMPDNCFPFSDAEETPGSLSKVTTTPWSKIGPQALRTTFKIETYGGVAFYTPTFNLYEHGVLSFRAVLLDGKLPEVQAQFENDAGLRKHIDITTLLKELGTDWRRIEVPLGQFLAFNPSGLDRVVKVSFVFKQGEGELGLDQVYLLKADEGVTKQTWTKPAYITPTPSPLPPGHGAWCYGTAPYMIDQVSHYNAGAPEDSKIRYLFPQLGSITFTDEGYAFSWKPERGVELHRMLKEARHDEVRILPMIDGLLHGAHQMTDVSWENLAQEIGAAIGDEAAFYGVHFDIEPHDNVVFNLFSKLRKHSDKPISAAVAHGDLDLFRYTDFAVLMAYDLGHTPEKLGEASDKRMEQFIKYSRAAGGRAMIGIPAIATHHEMESSADHPDGPYEPSGYLMEDFVKASLKVIGQHIKKDESAYMGLSIWALHEQEGLHGSRDTKWYYPTVIPETTWDLIRAPFSVTH